MLFSCGSIIEISTLCDLNWQIVWYFSVYFLVLFSSFFAKDQYASVAIPTHLAVDLRASWLAAGSGQRSRVENHQRRRGGTRGDEARCIVFALVQYLFKTSSVQRV